MSEVQLDVRAVPPPQRHDLILKRFEELKPGDELVIINDHEPLHLLYFMQHERDDFDASSYTAQMVQPGKWVARFRKKDVTSELSVRRDVEKAEVVITSFDRLREYDDISFKPVPVFEGKGYRVLLVFLRANQFIPIHSPKNDLVLLVSRGRGEVVAGESRVKVFPSSIVIVPSGIRRGVKAETDMEVLHLVSPPPTERDHEEVIRKLAEGRFE
jgi:uncharacterized protein (DUF2249 family)